MTQWYMLTVVGTDQPGIVARLSRTLFDAGAHLGEASMMRLGGNFSIMLMVGYGGNAAALSAVVAPIAAALDLHAHVDAIDGRLHEHVQPNVRVRVVGADRAGIVAQVTEALAAAGCSILDLESDVGGTAAQPLYIMIIEGRAQRSVEELADAVAALRAQGIDVRVEAADTLIG